MKLSIKYKPNGERDWILVREGGEYDQHAHFFTRRDAQRVRRLIDARRYPVKPWEKYAMQRILTEEEFKQLDKKDRYYNINRG